MSDAGIVNGGAEQVVPSLGKNVTLLSQPGRKLYVIGTAHISQESVSEVNSLIEEVRPTTVCLELCSARYTALTDINRWRNLDIFKVIREGKTLFLLANLAISAYQRKLGQQLGVRPGAEMLAAAERARALGAKVELIDRDIHVTLKRTWASLSLGDKFALLGAIVSGMFSRQEIDAQQIEQMKEKAQLSQMMREFSAAMPPVQQTLIDERDRYMSAGLAQSEGSRVVAVVGAGHVEGIQRYWGQEIDRPALEVIPPPSRWLGLLKWLIPVLILAAFSVGYFKNRGQTLEQMIYAWVLPNSIAAALLTAVAGGRLLSVLAALVGSPITSLNPLLGAGMVVGLVEAWSRRPTVQDAERINEDVQSLAGVYRNPFTRVLLVAVMATLGSAIGAWIGAYWVVSLL